MDDKMHIISFKYLKALYLLGLVIVLRTPATRQTVSVVNVLRITIAVKGIMKTRIVSM